MPIVGVKKRDVRNYSKNMKGAVTVNSLLVSLWQKVSYW